MFEKMVVSSTNGVESRISRFMAGSAISYLIGIAIAITGSILTTNPTLAGLAGGGNKMTAIPLASGHSEGNVSQHRPPTGLTQTSTAPSATNPHPIADVSAHLPGTGIPAPPTIGPIGVGDGPRLGDGNGPGPGCCGNVPGIGDGRDMPAPPPPRHEEIAKETKPVAPRSVRVSGQVLQGKAITKITPDYPTMARSIHVAGPVAVEVEISPDGHVESAHAISGHPLLMQAAVEAARHWRFEPTLLSGVAVRVTGVITFVFKLD